MRMVTAMLLGAVLALGAFGCGDAPKTNKPPAKPKDNVTAPADNKPAAPAENKA